MRVVPFFLARQRQTNAGTGASRHDRDRADKIPKSHFTLIGNRLSFLWNRFELDRYLTGNARPNGCSHEVASVLLSGLSSCRPSISARNRQPRQTGQASRLSLGNQSWPSPQKRKKTHPRSAAASWTMEKHARNLSSIVGSLGLNPVITDRAPVAFIAPTAI